MKAQILFSVLALLASSSSLAAEVSITMDDFNIEENTLLLPSERNERILAALKENQVKAALFVVGKFSQSKEGKALLTEWNENGHLIGNHSLTHPRYNNTSFENFTKEILQCEEALKGFSKFQKLFRFPTLAEGETPEKRDRLRTWLTERGYRNGHVTIDASDWYIDQRLREKLAADPNFDLTRFRDFYLQHMWERAQNYNELSKKVLGREVKHTLLVHFNLLNALFLKDLVAMFKARGWKMIDASEAFTDPAFLKMPNSMPSGQSLIWALAKQTGRYESELRYPGEDDTYEKPKMDALGL